MQTHEIIKRFTDHFVTAGHAKVPSASLLLDDPNLLFVNAGMVPFKPYLLGQAPAPWKTATSVQKVVRTLDIDEVGHTTRHCTFFQMAGNFSFGDYFKEGAIRHAWELLTTSQDAGGYGLDPQRLWATVYQDDDEAEQLWREVAGLPAERIQRRGMADNYWSMGVPGPCGPCSEIYYDRGPGHGAEGGPVADEDRYVELWNLVFMQFERGEGTGKGDFPIVGELPARNIDTGMGVERVAYVLQGVDNVYETDLVRPAITRAEQLSGRRYGADETDDRRFRVIADHVRTGAMLISDGVTPGNEARGYVLRRLLRRIVRSIRLLGVHDPVLGELMTVVRDTMSPSYPELTTGFDRIKAVAEAEEEAFLATLSTGSRIFDTAVRQTREAGSATLPGEQAFQLHDTYGFPIDLTLEMAAEAGLAVDQDGFTTLMSQQRTRAKADAAARKTGHGDAGEYRAVLDAHGPTEFLGYTDLEVTARVVGLLVDGQAAASAGEGTEVELVLDRTPFYAEGGGQLADTGVLRGGGVELAVRDVQRAVPGLFVHKAVVTHGEVALDTELTAHIDEARRAAVCRSHSATHLVHAAVRGAYGRTAAQAGSLNAPGRMRFDFTTPSSVTASVMTEVEAEVNDKLQQDTEVTSYVTTMDDAISRGAIALFGEKYGDRVRVVDMGDYSRELCGGTHVRRIGELGMVKLVADSSIGSGVHRVEALVGQDALRHVSAQQVLLEQLGRTLKARPEDLPARLESVLGRVKSLERELATMRSQAVLASAGGLVDAARTVGEVAVVAGPAQDGVSPADLRTLVTDVRGRLGERPGVVVLFSRDPGAGRVNFVAATTRSARDRGLTADHLVRAFAPAVGGRGGGKADLAQGGGSRPDGVAEAVNRVLAALRERSAVGG